MFRVKHLFSMSTRYSTAILFLCYLLFVIYYFFFRGKFSRLLSLWLRCYESSGGNKAMSDIVNHYAKTLNCPHA
jgi:hypothetical protein